MDLFIHRGQRVFIFTLRLDTALNKKKVWSLNYLNLEYYEQIPQMSNMVDNSIFLPNKSLKKKSYQN